jgi:molecular chaperone DnaJ
MMAAPHEVLGVAADASPAEVKRAYRRLAMRWHPDRNDLPEAVERFKEISAAYERLLAVDDENGAETADGDGVAEEDTPPRAADIRLNLELSLEEAAAGCRRKLRYVRGKPCPTCTGSGEAGIARTRFCGSCHGSGRIRDGRRGLSSCAACGGRGFFSERICPDCAGSGREAGEVELEIRVPPGMLAGDELRLAGQGEPAGGELAAGDLYLTVIIRSHPLFHMRGRDLFFTMPVSALALIAGGDLEVPVLGGRTLVTLEAGDATARELRLPAKGFPGRGKIPPGDLVVKLQPVFPTALGKKQRKALLEAEALLQEKAETMLPDVANWRRSYLPD